MRLCAEQGLVTRDNRTINSNHSLMKTLLLTCLAAFSLLPGMAYADALICPGDVDKHFCSVHTPEYKGDDVLVHCCSFLDRDDDPPAENSGITEVSDTHKDPICQSLPNSTGDVIIMEYNTTTHEPILSMKKNDGTIMKLFTYAAGKVQVTPPPTHEILWLTDNCFACVGCGRRNSFYAIYEIVRESPDNTRDATLIELLTEGRYRFRVKWSVEDGKLKALQYFHSDIQLSEINVLNIL